MITFINLNLSGPSVIAPKANKAAYLFFQSGLVMFKLTKPKTGSIISLPTTNAIAAKQQPDDNATPSSSSSSSSSSIFTL
jgi:hypothetical protein